MEPNTELVSTLRPRIYTKTEQVSGAMRLLKAMVQNGLREDGVPAAAALAVELDRPKSKKKRAA